MRWRTVCHRCGRTLYAPIDSRMHWHHCNPPQRRPRPRFAIPTYEGITREEARTAVFEAAVKALGGDKSIWRPLDTDDNAPDETGEP